MKRIKVIPQLNNTSSASPPTAKELLKLVKTSLEDDKAKDIVVIDIIGKSDIADYLVIASGNSGRHVAAIAGSLRDNLKKGGQDKVAVEGINQANWALVDCGDVVVHIFHPEVREFYNLEKMWGSNGKGEDGTISNNA
ncbi:MAG: ribosome silencing factor [Rhodospirillaceae bacterium]|nr:ribosome silencing factor [Rhodospirillaceae bacterium]MCK5546166.1 ribosome silencing factor [Rhodospirillaceae bacterium]